MRKIPTVGIDDRIGRRRRSADVVLLAVLLLASSPFIYEFVLRCVMRWKALFGQTMQVETPMLDAAASFFNTGHREILHQVNAFFHQGAWSTSVVTLFALFWTFVLAMLLRRC